MARFGDNGMFGGRVLVGAQSQSFGWLALAKAVSGSCVLVEAQPQCLGGSLREKAVLGFWGVVCWWELSRSALMALARRVKCKIRCHRLLVAPFGEKNIFGRSLWVLVRAGKS